MYAKQELKERISNLDPKTYASLRSKLIAKYKELFGEDYTPQETTPPAAAAAATTSTKPIEPAQAATTPTNPAAAATTPAPASHPTQPKPTTTAPANPAEPANPAQAPHKAAANFGDTEATGTAPAPPKVVASAGGIEATDTTTKATAQASTAHSKPYELSEPVKQIIKEFEATGDDGGYPPSAYYLVTEEVLRRYCRDNNIDYDELMKNNRIVKTQSFLTQAS